MKAANTPMKKVSLHKITTLERLAPQNVNKVAETTGIRNQNQNVLTKLGE
jgi:hypothetical protein